MRALLLALAALALAAPAAAAETQTASSGSVAATLSYTPGQGGFTASDIRIAVTRSGVLAYDAPVGVRACRRGCAPLPSDAVTVRDLDADGDPEVLVDLTTGGAHCCSVTRILRWDGARYLTIDHSWGNRFYSADDVDGDGRVELVSGDDRFAYLYGSYATSRFPVQVLALQAGRLADTTRSYPALIREDRAAHWRLAHGELRAFPRGAYAAWAADRYLLGERAAALRTLRGLAARGRLRTDLGANSRRGQRRWVARLDRDLRRFGYAGQSSSRR
jgi:hypothetical protein